MKSKLKNKFSSIYPSSFGFGNKFSSPGNLFNSEYLLKFSMKLRSNFRIILLIVYVVCFIVIITNGDNMMFKRGFAPLKN